MQKWPGPYMKQVIKAILERANEVVRFYDAEMSWSVLEHECNKVPSLESDLQDQQDISDN